MRSIVVFRPTVVVTVDDSGVVEASIDWFDSIQTASPTTMTPPESQAWQFIEDRINDGRLPGEIAR